MPMTTVTASDAGAPALKPARFLAANEPQAEAGRVRPLHLRWALHRGLRSLRRSLRHRRAKAGDARRARRARHPIAARRREPSPTRFARHWSTLAPWMTEAAFEEINLREVLRRPARKRRARADGSSSPTIARRRGARDECALRPQGNHARIQRARSERPHALVAARASRDAHRVPPGMRHVRLPLEPSVAARLQRLREAAPFGELTWTATLVDGARSRVRFSCAPRTARRRRSGSPHERGRPREATASTPPPRPRPSSKDCAG